jgi:predicted metalloprotease with PDZ domain
MTRRIVVWSLMLVVAVALPLAAGEKHDHAKCTADTQTCLNKMAMKMKESGWVGIEMEKNENGSLTIVNVVEGSPAEAAGLHSGDVILAVNGIAYGDENKEKLHAVKKQMKVGKTIEYTVQRKGKSKDVEITLGQVPDDVIASWIGRHMMADHAAIELAQN